MIKFNHLIFAFSLSILIHVFFIFQLQKSNVEDEIYVIDLSSYKEFKAKKIEVQKTTNQTNKPEKKNQKEIVKEKPEIKNQKEIVEKKQENVIPIKKNENQKLEKVKKKKEEFKKIEKRIETRSDQNFNQKKVLQNDNKKKLLIDKQIKLFLMKISQEINKVAVKSYPIQSIKRREQGTIVAVIVLNSEGKLIEMNFENKRPKRLYEKTRQILKNYKFPKPPSIIFEQENTFSVKIPVNYILK